MTHIVGIQRLEETTRRTRCSGDNWHMTWAQDDRQYVGLCDGRGWPEIAGYTGKEYNTRMYAIRGDPPQPAFEHLPGYPDLFSEPPLQTHRYYGFGILALDGRIYHFLSTPNHRFFGGPKPRFVGAKLIYSPDHGQSWRNQDGGPVRWEPWEERSRANMVFFEEPGEAFALLTVLQMGRNYEHNRDGYVYVYAPNGNAEGTMNQLVMFRARKERLLDRSAYEYFAERRRDGSAAWTSDIAQRGVVHTFPAGWVNTQIHPYAWHPSVVYVAPLGVYLMANWGMGCAPDGMWFGKPSYLGFWTAPQPWGPWTQVHEETAWMPAGDPAARAYQPQISPKWIAPDGRSFWLVHTDFQEIDGGKPYYSFNYQQVKVITK
ncbi:MAG: DUF4185 domain-containing protein [Chloroflexi bacterium]|nr:DUF4185 domain-containing protein [Chloroflexota bacterium]